MDEVRTWNGYRGGRGRRRGRPMWKSNSYYRGSTYRGNYNYYSNRNHKSDKVHPKYEKKIPLRPASPIEGTEEFMTLKIQETSAKIMHQLLNPDESITSNGNLNSRQTAVDSQVTNPTGNQLDDKVNHKTLTKNKKVNSINLSAKEIYEKIMNYIASLKDCKKKNFINANNSTGLDNAINQMQKRKRLEISRILRDMSSGSNFPENGDCSNSIVPDSDIKLEDLHINLIEELKRTLNLDLEQLNEVIDANPDNYEEGVIILSGSGEIELDPAVEVKTENTGEELPLSLPEAMSCENRNSESENEINNLHHSFWIKDEVESASVTNSCCAVREATPISDGWRHESDSTEPNSNAVLHDLESSILQCIERDKNVQCADVASALRKMHSINACVRHLLDYSKICTETFIASFGNAKKNDAILCSRPCLVGPNQIQTKKRKLTDIEHPNRQNEILEEAEIKLEASEALEIAFSKFPFNDEKVISLERVDDELIIGTDKGNIMFASLKDSSLEVLNISENPITSLSFVRGKDYVTYMYVGSQEMLRIYDLKKRTLLKSEIVEDQIRCMDAQWHYLFMGCKNGSLIRYSCNKEKIDFEKRNTGNDILVIKATQEGPRRVLLVGHRQAPIYVRDAMSGLFLRRFSDQAIAPTVYSIIINHSNLYCGTARDNILVFSFHEGRLIEKIVADDSKGISCMKIYKNVLFAGCYNGSIYIFNLKVERNSTVLQGPGGGIMCMEILDRQIIVGTLSGHLDPINLPSDVFCDV